MRSTQWRWFDARRCAALLLGIGLALSAASTARARSVRAADATAPARRTSTMGEPGWYPTVDPESASVVIRRRLNAPFVSKPFGGGTRSLAAMGRAVCSALRHQSVDSLLALCVRDDEFRDILWREFPQSRPATGLQWQDGWLVLYARLHGGSVSAVSDHGGHYYEFLRWEHDARPDTLVRYRNFKLHNGMILVARDDRGEIQRFRWLRSIAERRGVFKIYSMQD